MPEDCPPNPIDPNDVSLRSYPAPWKGQVLLACGKCRRKLKNGSADKEVRKLKKALKRRSKMDEDGVRLRVIEVPCLKMCPKGGVTVCTQAQLGRGECSIVWTAADVDALYAQCKAEGRNEVIEDHAA
jgi:predicted metal-binding protein